MNIDGWKLRGEVEKPTKDTRIIKVYLELTLTCPVCDHKAIKWQEVAQENSEKVTFANPGLNKLISVGENQTCENCGVHQKIPTVAQSEFRDKLFDVVEGQLLRQILRKSLLE